MASDSDDTRQRLQQAIEHHRQALEQLQEALLAELDSYKHEEDATDSGE
jgi:hypothetical protein